MGTRDLGFKSVLQRVSRMTAFEILLIINEKSLLKYSVQSMQLLIVKQEFHCRRESGKGKSERQLQDILLVLCSWSRIKTAIIGLKAGILVAEPIPFPRSE